MSHRTPPPNDSRRQAGEPFHGSPPGLARRRRPQTFDEIVGQEAVSTTLKNAISEKTTAHAYLFFGPRGVGKTTTARILAKALNCAQGPTPEPCGQCDPCAEIARSAAIDVLELDAATHTQVDRIREMILETVSLAPSRDRFKVFIIDEVHMLSTASFNALLKTLEEPPAHVVFILATTDPQKIPATIVSRCQRFRFRPLPLDLLAGHLRKLAKAERIPVDPEALDLLARAAGGSLRDGASLLEQASAYAEGAVGAGKVRELLGQLPEAVLLELGRAILGKDVEGVAKALEGVWAEGGDAGQLLRDLREQLHAAYLHRLGVAGDASPEWRALAEPHPPEALGYLVGRVNKILEALRTADSPRLTLELGFYGMLEAAYDLRGWLQRLEALEKRLTAGEASTRPRQSSTREEPAAPRPAHVLPAEKGGDIWSAVLRQVREEKPGLADEMEVGRLLCGDGDEWRLVFPKAYALERAQGALRLIEAKLATVSGKSIRLRLEIGQSADKAAEARWEDVADDASHEDPGVRKVLDIFPGKVRHVKGKG